MGPQEGAAAVPAGEGLQKVRVALGEARSLLPPEAVLLGEDREEEASGSSGRFVLRRDKAAQVGRNEGQLGAGVCHLSSGKSSDPEVDAERGAGIGYGDDSE